MPRSILQKSFSIWICMEGGLYKCWDLHGGVHNSAFFGTLMAHLHIGYGGFNSVTVELIFRCLDLISRRVSAFESACKVEDNSIDYMAKASCHSRSTWRARSHNWHCGFNSVTVGLIFRCLDPISRRVSSFESAWKVGYTNADICMVVCTTGHFLAHGGPICILDTVDLFL